MPNLLKVGNIVINPRIGVINIDGVNAGSRYYVQASVPNGEEALSIEQKLKLLRMGRALTRSSNFENRVRILLTLFGCFVSLQKTKELSGILGIPGTISFEIPES